MCSRPPVCESAVSVVVSPLGACVACLAGRFRLWDGALSLARTWLHASPGLLYSILRLCGGAGGVGALVM